MVDLFGLFGLLVFFVFVCLFLLGETSTTLVDYSDFYSRILSGPGGHEHAQQLGRDAVANRQGARLGCPDPKIVGSSLNPKPLNPKPLKP